MALINELLPDDSEGNRRIHGITTGIVTKNWDEAHPGMVQVEIHMGEDKNNVTKWVRVMQPYAGKEYGFYMLPEIKSEVLIAFNMGDVNMPYVIGGLWNEVNKLPKDAAQKDNNIKKIRTSGGNEIIFDDIEGKENILIKTPKELKITIDDDKQTISIGDKKGKNIISIDSKNGEIVVKAKNKVTLDAGKAKIILDGKMGKASINATDVSIEAQKAVTIKAKQMSESASMYEVKSNGVAKIESNGMLQLKGQITKIN